MKRVEITETDLRRLYVEGGIGIREIAEKYHCSHTTICTRLHECGIPIVKSKSKPMIKPIIPGEPINCNNQGEACIYRGRKSDGMKDMCDYFFKTGKLRWCDPEHCDKYKFE